MHDVRGEWLCVTELVLLVFSLWCLTPCHLQMQDCDVTIRSTLDPVNGTFHSTNYPEHYPERLRCIYRFVARPNERVYIRFEKFDLKGVPPKCTHDFIDVYTQIRGEDDDLLELPLHGRYCGHNLDDLPHLLVSMYNILIIGFYTDEYSDTDTYMDRGFLGKYSFVDASKYVVGTPDPTDFCGQTVQGASMPTGVLLSPTYPGVYPDNIFCYYKLQGVKGQRIRFTFLDMDLYSGGEHCPYDHIKIYDGKTNMDEVIGTYCGRLKDLSIYSTGEALRIEFKTRSGREEPTKKSYVPYWDMEDDPTVQRRGFKAEFEISSRFVNLDFITEGEHVRGTECDQRILSTGESNGIIISPNYPDQYPMNVTCRYFIDGLVDRQNLEKASLTFQAFNLPFLDHSNVNEDSATDSIMACDNGHLSAYLKGQDMTTTRPDYVICGTDIPNQLETKDPRLLLEFSTDRATLPGTGFKAQYQFLTDYAIPGTPVGEGCHFQYHSSSQVKGVFNSPRHPSNYPHNSVCTYEFFGGQLPNIRIKFENFNVGNRVGNCSTDFVKLFKITSDGREVLVGHYCGSQIPGPLVIDSNRTKAIFSSDDKLDNGQFNAGFKASYEFLERKPCEESCMQNITSGGGGVIKSPHHPHKYRLNCSCEWHVYTRHKDARIMIVLDEKFDMEGNKDDKGPGCENAVLKVYTSGSGLPDQEICGKGPQLSQREFISEKNHISLQFITATRAVGAKGFQITWTEILSNSSASSQNCQGFRCEQSGHCIAGHLVCNEYQNCGENDTSDEPARCQHDYADQSVLHIILGVVVALVLLVFLIVCILHRRRKLQKRRNKKEIEVRYVTRSATGNSHHHHHQHSNSNKYMDHNHDFADRSLLTERTEKVSIV